MEPEPSTQTETMQEAIDSNPVKSNFNACGCLILLFPLFDVCFAGAIICKILAAMMPMWSALLLGIPLGIGITVLIIQSWFRQNGGSLDAIDFVVVHTMVLIVALCLIFVSSQARTKKRHAIVTPVNDVPIGPAAKRPQGARMPGNAK